MLVLIVGHRREISKILEKKNISYAIWTEKPIKSSPNTDKIIVSPFLANKESTIEILSLLTKNIPITHVIAGTESAVLFASRLRQWTKAMKNPHSTIERCSDKLKMKEYLSEKGIPMTVFMDSQSKLSTEEIFTKLGSPVIVKRRLDSGGRSLQRINSQSDLESKKESGFIFEKAISGTEGSIESFVSDRKIIFESITRYVFIGSMNLVPADYSEEIKNHILDLNRKVISALNIKWGMTHLEYYVTDEGILFGEIALRPPGGYLMRLLKSSYGINPWSVFCDVELGLKPEIAPKSNLYSISVIFPRQEGVVKSISGEEEVKNLPTLEKLKIRVKVGDTLQRRHGVGDDMGYAILSSSNCKKVLEDAKSIEKILKIKIDCT